MRTYNTPTSKKHRITVQYVMPQVSVKCFDPIEDPDDDNGGLTNHFNVWDEM